MKRDKTLNFAVALLICLVGLLIFITLDQKKNNETTKFVIEDLQTQLSKINTSYDKPEDGKTPVLGVDYFIPQPIPGANGQSIQGVPGLNIKGDKGDTGANGASAYDIAVKNGYEGTEAEWVESLKPKPVPPTDLDIQCLAGLIAKRLMGDEVWQVTNIKCEVSL